MYSSAAVSISQILPYPPGCQNMPGFWGAGNGPVITEDKYIEFSETMKCRGLCPQKVTI